MDSPPSWAGALRWRRWPRPLRFVLAGGLITAAGYAWYAVAIAAGASVPVATAVSMLLNIPLGFLTHGHWVFGRAPQRRMARYAAVWFLVGVCNAALIQGLMATLGLDAYAAGAVAIVPVAALSYGLQRRFVFAAQ